VCKSLDVLYLNESKGPVGRAPLPAVGPRYELTTERSIADLIFLESRSSLELHVSGSRCTPYTT
jgi:hypothetical protein